MAGLVDGLGFEEIGQVGSQLASLWVTGSIVSDSTIKAVNISGTTAIRGQNIITPGSITATDAVIGAYISGTTAIRARQIVSPGSIVDVNGILQSVGGGSPATYGARIFVGSVTTDAGSAAFVSAGATLPSTNYWVTSTARQSTTIPALFVSGARSTSGINAVGAASISYDYAIYVLPA